MNRRVNLGHDSHYVPVIYFYDQDRFTRSTSTSGNSAPLQLLATVLHFNFWQQCSTSTSGNSAPLQLLATVLHFNFWQQCSTSTSGNSAPPLWTLVVIRNARGKNRLPLSNRTNSLLDTNITIGNSSKCGLKFTTVRVRHSQ